MDYGAEIINISKIKDSFFIGDKIAGTNLDVLIQFKISHIINAAGNQIINIFESIGIQYFTLNWSENPNQILFDQNDEIVDKILFFIKESLTKGEGLLIHSLKGKDRCCIVVIIYLMKKYNWSVKKCIDFLKSKKEDVEIEPYFLEQLLSYEMRLSKITKIKSTNWIEITCKDNDENLLRNTYVNGLPVNQLNSVGINQINTNKINNDKDERGNLIKKNNIHINWAENDNLVNYNFEKELLFQSEIKDITCHISSKPIKSSIKAKSRNDSSLTQSLSANSKTNINISNNNFINPGNINKKKLKIRADVDIDKISSEYNNISPNILKQLIENDSFYFFTTTKNNTYNNLHNSNSEKNNRRKNNIKNKPLSYDNKNKIKNKKEQNKIFNNEQLNNGQFNIKSNSLNKNGNINKKIVYNNDMNKYYINEQNKIKKLIENNQGNNRLLISLNNQNKMNVLINYFTYSNNFSNGNSQSKKVYNNYLTKNSCNNNSNYFSNSLKRSNRDDNKNKNKSK